MRNVPACSWKIRLLISVNLAFLKYMQAKTQQWKKITDLAVGKRNPDRVKTQQDVLRGSKEAEARKKHDSRKLGKSITIE